MIISGQAITLIMQIYSEDAIMSILTAIIQAILQAVCVVFPISESGHSSIFHDFAGRQAGSCSAITGVIHIGIAIGIVLAMLKFFVTMGRNFIGTFADMFSKKLKGSGKRPARYFMYMSLIAFAPMIFWIVPTGKGLLYSLLHTTAYNSTLLDDGIMFCALGALVIMSAKTLEIGRNSKSVNILSAIAAGLLSVLLVPVSGLSLVMGIYAVLLLFGVANKFALRFAFLISAPVYVVVGIVEICTAVTSAGWVEIILGLIISVAVSFLSVRIFKWVINTGKLKYFAFYDISIGVIIAIIGIFELALK